jgi:putative flippase GtrA
MNLKSIIGHPYSMWLLNHRFVKFGSVGFTGTLVNLGVLFVGQEFIFRSVVSADTRLNLSLGLAIFSATLSNFTLNRIWTWADRKEEIEKQCLLQLGQYFLACWLAIAIQFFLTKTFVHLMHYLAANAFAILVSSGVNFLVNDAWTFRANKDFLTATGIENVEGIERDV